MANVFQILAKLSGGVGGALAELKADREGGLLVSHSLPRYTEITRRGGGWSLMNTAALAALVIRPSTLSNFTLFNNNPSGSDLCYIIDRAFAFNLVSTAAQARSGLWLCVHPPGLVTPANDITARASSSGKVTANEANAMGDTNMTVTDDGWFPWGPWSDVEPTGVLPGAIMVAEIEGRLIVPPQCGISTQVVSGVVGNTFTSGFSFYVQKLKLGAD